MNKIFLEKKDVFDYLHDVINKCSINQKELSNDYYHHNASYKDGKNIIKNGLLSLEELNRLGIKKFSNDQLTKASDILSHVNGIDGISLSKVGLTDLYRDEEEYNPYSPNCLDILISRKIKASRSSLHYGNEFICYSKIDRSLFRSIDIRILKLFKYELNKENIVKKYNYLLETIKKIEKYNLNILVREMSDNQINLNINKLSEQPKIFIK